MEFKPGAYTKGSIVTVNGVQFVADRDILNAQAIPKENMYWSVVAKPEPAPLPTSGLSPANTPEQNSLAIEALLNIPEGGCKSIYIPAGNYHFARQITIYRRPVYLYGDSGTIFGNSTKLFFPPGSTGIAIDRGGTSIQETIIERICVISESTEAGSGDGFVLLARAKLRDCTAKGFGHHGFAIWANIEEGNDASGSTIQSCHSLENKQDGFFAGRTDANAITFINCDSRNNGRYGFNDDSFLGNHFISCMAHDNKEGHWFVRDKGNARTGLMLCYAEGGSPVSYLSIHTTVVGGFHASGYTLDGTNIIYQ